MKLSLYIVIISLAFVLAACSDNPVSGPENVDNGSIAVLDCYISEENQRLLNENRFSNLSVPADIFVGEEKYSARIEAQGAGSRYFPKWGYFVRLGNDKRIEGENEFNLSIQPYDRSMMRSALASYLYSSAGFTTFHSSHAFLRINDKDKGLYVLTEKVDYPFFARRNLPVHELVKVVFGAKFTFSEPNNLKDNFEKKIPDDNNFSNLEEFIHELDNAESSNIFTGIGRFIDIKQYLTYHAITSVMNNTDGLGNNFYLVKHQASSPYQIIPWDFDKTFDPQANLGFAGNNAIIQKLFTNDSCVTLYKAALKDLLENHFTENKLYNIIDSVYNKIKTAYGYDSYLGGSGVSLEKETTGLKAFITNRRNYLLNNIDLFHGL